MVITYPCFVEFLLVWVRIVEINLTKSLTFFYFLCYFYRLFHIRLHRRLVLVFRRMLYLHSIFQIFPIYNPSFRWVMCMIVLALVISHIKEWEF